LRKYIKEIGSHSAIYSISNILTKALGIILIPVYTAYLTVEDYGIISIVSPLAAALAVFYRFGLRSGYGRFFFDYKDRSKEQKQLLGSITLFVLSIGLIFSLALSFFGKPIFDNYFPGVDFYPYVILGIWISYFLLAYDLKLNLFRLRRQPIYYGIFSFMKFLTILVLTIIAVVGLNYGALGKIGAEFITVAVFFVLAVALLWKDISFKINFRKLVPVLKYSIPLIPHDLAAIIMGLSAKFFINLNLGTAAAGIYNIAFLIGTIMNIIITSVNLSWNPFFMSTAKEKTREEASLIFSKLTTYYAMAIVFIGLVVAIFSQEAIMILTNEKYYAAIKIAPIIVLSYILRGGYYIVVAKIFYVKKATKYLALITLSSAIVDIILNAILVPWLGMLGSAISFSLTSFILFTLTYFVSQKVYYIKYDYKRLFIIFMIALVVITGFILIMLFISNLVWAIVAKVFLLSLYILLLFSLRFLTKSEISNLKDILQKIKKRKNKK
jgi:O-antigen/teichoic acid export membrane protein